MRSLTIKLILAGTYLLLTQTSFASCMGADFDRVSEKARHEHASNSCRDAKRIAESCAVKRCEQYLGFDNCKVIRSKKTRSGSYSVKREVWKRIPVGLRRVKCKHEAIAAEK